METHEAPDRRCVWGNCKALEVEVNIGFAILDVILAIFGFVALIEDKSDKGAFYIVILFYEVALFGSASLLLRGVW